MYRPVRAAWQAIQARRFRGVYRRLTHKLIAARGSRVMSGPFAGMAYLDSARSSALLPKLLGTYEDELHAVLEQMLSHGYDTVVDIGSAEGYYAVGLALRLPHSRVFAYDIDPIALRKCEELAELNGVAQRITFHSRFETARMKDIRAGRTLVVCDVDGYELELFAERNSPFWAEADLLVELHDFIGKPCRQTVERCLAPTHRLEIVSSVDKDENKLSDFAFLTPDERRLAVSEIRPHQEWLIAHAR